jgi:hypothetical protein
MFLLNDPHLHIMSANIVKALQRHTFFSENMLQGIILKGLFLKNCFKPLSNLNRLKTVSLTGYTEIKVIIVDRQLILSAESEIACCMMVK